MHKTRSQITICPRSLNFHAPSLLPSARQSLPRVLQIPKTYLLQRVPRPLGRSPRRAHCRVGRATKGRTVTVRQGSACCGCMKVVEGGREVCTVLHHIPRKEATSSVDAGVEKRVLALPNSWNPSLGLELFQSSALHPIWLCYRGRIMEITEPSLS